MFAIYFCKKKYISSLSFSLSYTQWSPTLLIALALVSVSLEVSFIMSYTVDMLLSIAALESVLEVLLNASIDFKVPYFSLLDIKKIINSNIDYLISKNLYSKDISSYIYESKIPILMKNVYSKCPKDINTLKLIINDLERINTYEEKN